MFLKGGREALVRTKQYLEAGNVIFRNSVKILSINYLPEKDISRGVNKFVTWVVPQIQFKNPKLQVMLLMNVSPTPFVQCYLDKGSEFLIDCSFRSQVDIHNMIRDSPLCRSYQELEDEAIASQTVINPANFGKKYPRQCICEVYGHMPCPSLYGQPNTEIMSNMKAVYDNCQKLAKTSVENMANN